jgi:hypothetical protein
MAARITLQHRKRERKALSCPLAEPPRRDRIYRPTASSRFASLVRARISGGKEKRRLERIHGAGKSFRRIILTEGVGEIAEAQVRRLCAPW